MIAIIIAKFSLVGYIIQRNEETYAILFATDARYLDRIMLTTNDVSHLDRIMLTAVNTKEILRATCLVVCLSPTY